MDRHSLCERDARAARVRSLLGQSVCNTPRSSSDEAKELLELREPILDTVRLEQTLAPELIEYAQKWRLGRSRLRRQDGKSMFLKVTNSRAGFVYCVWEGSAYSWATDPGCFVQPEIQGELLSMPGRGPVVSIDEAYERFQSYRAAEDSPIIARRFDVAFDFPVAYEKAEFVSIVRHLLEGSRAVSVNVSDGGAAKGCYFRVTGEPVKLFGDLAKCEIVLYDKRAEVLRNSRGRDDVGPRTRIEIRFFGRFSPLGSVERALRNASGVQAARLPWFADLLISLNTKEEQVC